METVLSLPNCLSDYLCPPNDYDQEVDLVLIYIALRMREHPLNMACFMTFSALSNFDLIMLFPTLLTSRYNRKPIIGTLSLILGSSSICFI